MPWSYGKISFRRKTLQIKESTAYRNCGTAVAQSFRFARSKPWSWSASIATPLGLNQCGQIRWSSQVFQVSAKRVYYIFKVIIYSVVSLSMTDNEIIKLVWGVMVLKQRFEDDPYSLSVEEIKLLREHYKRQTCWAVSLRWRTVLTYALIWSRLCRGSSRVISPKVSGFQKPSFFGKISEEILDEDTTI